MIGHRFEPPDMWPGFADLFAGFALIVSAYSVLVPVVAQHRALETDRRFDRLINVVIDRQFPGERGKRAIILDTTEVNRAFIALPGAITFRFNSAELQDSARVTLLKLKPLIEVLRREGIPRFYLTGYADTTQFRKDAHGFIRTNLELSARRATNAAAFLTGPDVGLPETLLVISAAGANDPWRRGEAIDKDRSRRIEIEIPYTHHQRW